ncbi:hypothetical protein [Sporofaciens musculi]|nr:hypothetical protein [Sporofaciens musculi]
MKINTQGLLFTQSARKNTFHSFFNSFIKKPVSQEREWKQELHQKMSELTRKSNGPLMSFIRETEVPIKVASEMDRYYNAVGNAVDNLTCMEEQIKYMQSEYDKAVSQGDDVKSETLSKWMKNQYADMSWQMSSVIGISHFRIDNASKLYGEAFGEEAKKQLTDLHDNTENILQGLKGAQSTEDALQRLAKAKEDLMKQAHIAEQRYADYTGNQLSPYTYKTEKDFSGIKWDSHVIYNYTLDSVKPMNSAINLKGYQQISFDQLDAAENIVDLHA